MKQRVEGLQQQPLRTRVKKQVMMPLMLLVQLLMSAEVPPMLLEPVN